MNSFFPLYSQDKVSLYAPSSLTFLATGAVSKVNLQFVYSLQNVPDRTEKNKASERLLTKVCFSGLILQAISVTFNK